MTGPRVIQVEVRSGTNGPASWASAPAASYPPARAEATAHRGRPTRRCGGPSCPPAGCGWWRPGSPPTGTSWTRPYARSSRPTARRTTTASSTPTRPRSSPPALAHHHRPARLLRPRPDHRRLPAGRAVRRRPLIAEPSGRKAALDARLSTDDVIRDREELAEQIRALGELKQMAAVLRLRHLRPGRAPRREAIQWLYFAYLAATKEQNGAAMSLGRTSTFLDVYLQRDLDEGRLDRGRRPGAGRRLRHQAADHPLPAHPRVRPAVLRRPDLGDRVARRHRLGRPAPGHPHQLPLPADAVQPRARARAEPDRAVVAGAARRLQAVLRPGVAGHQRDPVRERRPDPARVRRRHRDRLLRVGHAGRQGHAVLRRPRQPGQGTAVRDQRRPRRDDRRAGRPADARR